MNRRWVLGACAVALAGMLTASRGGAQIQQGKTRPLKTKHMMSALIGPNCTSLNKALQENGPADDKAWEAAAINAALLNESGHALMADGRCPDATWAAASKALQDASQAVLLKVEARDTSGARQAFAGVLASCKSCHMAHKKPAKPAQ